MTGGRTPMKLPVMAAVTEREWLVLREVLKGHGMKEAGGVLGVSEQTIKNQLSDVYRKVGAASLLEAGWITGLIVEGGSEAKAEYVHARRLAKLYRMFMFLSSEALAMAEELAAEGDLTDDSRRPSDDRLQGSGAAVRDRGSLGPPDLQGHGPEVLVIDEHDRES